MLTPAAVMVKEGESADVAVSYELSKKVQAAGGKATTYKLFAESSDEKVATVSVDGNNKIMVKGVAKSATPATITVYAAQVNDLAKAKEVKIKLTEKFDVKVSSKLEAKQAGANKIKVMGTDLVASKSAYVIKNANGGNIEVKEVKVNDAKTEAVVETVTTQIPEGDYKFTYNAGDTVDFKIEKVKATKIEITPTGTAILGANKQTAYVYYRALDQFDNDVTNTAVVNLRVNSPESHSEANGKITFTTTKANGYQYNYDRISVSIVDLNNPGLAATALLTVGDAAKVVDAEYAKIYNVSKKEIVESITDGDNLNNFRILFTAKDQYGHDLVEDANAKELAVYLSGTTGVTSASAPTVMEFKGKKYYAYQLTNTDANSNSKPSRAGEVNVQAISTNTGKSVAAKFNVVASSKVDSLRIWEGKGSIFNGKKNELSFAAYDASGKEIKDWDNLKALNDNKYLGDNSKLYFERKSDGTVGLFYDLEGTKKVPGLANSDTTTVPLFIRTLTDKYLNVTLNVKAEQRAVGIVGLKSDFTKGVVAGRDFAIKANDFRYQDQYGNIIEASDLPTGYKVDVTVSVDKKDKRAFDYSGHTGTDLANSEVVGNTGDHAVPISDEKSKIVDLEKSTAVNADIEAYVTVRLRKDTESLGEEKKFTVYAVPLAKMNGFEIKDPGLKAAPEVAGTTYPNGMSEASVADAAKFGFKPTVYGLYAGEKITLTNDVKVNEAGSALEGTADYMIVDSADHPEINVANKGKTSGQNVAVPSLKVETDRNEVVTKKAEFTVIIADGKGTTLKKEYSYSNAVRSVKSGKLISGDGTVNLGDIDASGSKNKGWNDIKTQFEFKDQYGDIVEVAPYITISGLSAESDKKTNIQFVDPKKNGTANVELKTNAGVAVNGTTDVTLKLTFKDSTYVFDQNLTLKKTS